MAKRGKLEPEVLEQRFEPLDDAQRLDFLKFMEVLQQGLVADGYAEIVIRFKTIWGSDIEIKSKPAKRLKRAGENLAC